jgi:hypothetical protein
MRGDRNANQSIERNPRTPALRASDNVPWRTVVFENEII